MYDLTNNTGRVGREKAVDLILEYLKLRFDLDITQLRNQESQI